MESIIGFPVSIAVILAFSILMLWRNKDNTMAKGIAYISGIMLIISVGFTINLFIPESMTNLGLVATFAAAIVLFLKAADFVNWKMFFILILIETVAVSVWAAVINIM